MKTIIILGSNRRNGNTAKVANEIASRIPADLVNLLDYKISPYDYEHHNRTDDFLPLIREIIEGYDTLIIATPVYWYSMSSVMKVFFDRLSDLLTIEKDLGRQLRGKGMAVINSSNGGNLGDDFWHPFVATADYLGMTYLGHQHTLEGESNASALAAFLSNFPNDNPFE